MNISDVSLFLCMCVCVSVCPTLPHHVYLAKIKSDERRCGLSLDLLLSPLHFVVERAFVAWTHDAQVFLAGALEEGMNGKSVMDIEATGLKWVLGRNGFGGDRGREIARVSFKKKKKTCPLATTLLK